MCECLTYSFVISQSDSDVCALPNRSICFPPQAISLPESYPEHKNTYVPHCPLRSHLGGCCRLLLPLRIDRPDEEAGEREQEEQEAKDTGGGGQPHRLLAAAAGWAHRHRKGGGVRGESQPAPPSLPCTNRWLAATGLSPTGTPPCVEGALEGAGSRRAYRRREGFEGPRLPVRFNVGVYCGSGCGQ